MCSTISRKFATEFCIISTGNYTTRIYFVPVFSNVAQFAWLECSKSLTDIHISTKLRSDNYAISILQNYSVNFNGLFSAAHCVL